MSSSPLPVPVPPDRDHVKTVAVALGNRNTSIDVRVHRHNRPDGHSVEVRTTIGGTYEGAIRLSADEALDVASAMLNAVGQIGDSPEAQAERRLAERMRRRDEA